MLYQFESVKLENFTETTVDQFPEKTIYTTADWYKYLQLDCRVKPVIIRISQNNRLIGYFYGGEIRKFGLKIIASPFSGWSTCWMGFETVPGVDKFDLLGPLWNYLTHEQGYFYGEVIDRDFALEEAQRRGYICEPFPTLDLRIDRTDEELFKVFKTDCRNFIRQFERRGASIEIAEPNNTFAEEYYDQLRDVFAKQGLTPSYSLDKIKHIMAVFGKTDKILCLRVRAPDGRPIASSIFFGFNNKCFYWGGASYRPDQHYRPNEYMIWTAIRYWRERGCTVMDMVGDRTYKHKFGPEPVSYALIYLTKYPFLITLRNWAKKLYWTSLRIKETLSGHKRDKEGSRKNGKKTHDSSGAPAVGNGNAGSVP